MKPCKAERPVTCPFGKKGSAWSTGEHGGIDFGCPGGDPVYAMWGGKVTGNSWGSAYGTHIVIDHDTLPDGDPGLWGLYAHLKSKTVGSGDRVEAGDLIGYSNNTGNSSGSHLHIEIQPQANWVKGSYRDPQPWIDAGGSGGGSTYYVTGDVYRSKMGYGEPTNGDDFSDSVKELQERLNRISLEGGQELSITGRYDDDTDDEVRKWQDQICGDPPDPAGQSYLGPNQFKAMFPDSVYSLHDDGDPAIADAPTDGGGGENPPPGGGGGGDVETGGNTTLGRALKDRGFVVYDENAPYGRESTWRGVDFLMVHHTVSPDDGDPADIASYIRNGGSGTYPPLAQIMLAQDGAVWMCSKERSGQESPGRASHAGSGDGYGVPDDTMNEYSLGIECQADGKSPLSDYPVMYSALIRLLWHLSDIYGVPSDKIIGHKEWSSTNKVDPLDDMDDIRADVDAYVDTPPDPEEPPVTEPPDPEPIEPEPGEPIGIVTEFGLWKWYGGKETSDWKLHPDGDWHKLPQPAFKQPASGISNDSVEHHFLYLRIELPSGRSADRVFESRYIRSDGDATAYDSKDYGLKKNSHGYYNFHTESGSGLGGHWEVKVTGGTDPITITTRYAKTHVLHQDENEIAAAAMQGTFGVSPSTVRVLAVLVAILAVVAIILAVTT